MKAREKIAIVTPWFGPECKGGAESLAAELARRLGAHVDVDVLTTCSLSFLSDWAANVHAAGATEEDGYTIRRFAVDRRAARSFDAFNADLLAIEPHSLRSVTARIPAPTQLTFVTENINSSEMMRFIAENREQYHRFLFLPYLYGTTLRGIAAAGERAVLQPCLHDESYAYLRPVAEAVHRASALLFNSDGELQLARRIYGPGIDHKSVVVGSGVEVLHAPAGRAALPDGVIAGAFALYLGRRDATKGVELLIEAFRRAAVPDFKLVLAGPGNGSYGDGGAVVDLGFVDDDVRSTLLQHAAFLAQPSTNESFSRAIMETWAYERPVLAHARCLATAGAVTLAGGGMVADSAAEWSVALERLVRLSAEERDALGRAGKAYATANADWTGVIDRYLAAFARHPSAPLSGGAAPAIHQVVETLEYGDAISNEAIAIRDRLRTRGFASDILVRHVGARVNDEARLFVPEILESTSALVYHHSIGSDLTRAVIDSELPTLMIYHNITPAAFFRRLRPDLAVRLERGRADLRSMNRVFDIVAADSEFNAAELRELGYEHVEVLPIVLDFRRFDVAPDAGVMRSLADGRRTLLFVGRYAPNKALHDLIDVLAVLRRAGSPVRLVLAGRSDGNESYVAELHAQAARLGVAESVVFSGTIGDAELLAYYLSADAFVSLSDHEGFCVPLVEAMAFGVPVVAFAGSAVGETLGDAGIQLRDKSDPEAIAALLRVVLDDAASRAALARDGHRRLAAFSQERTLDVLDRLVAQLEASPAFSR